MKCIVHPDRDAIGACCSCGRYVCPECKVVIDNQIYCNLCLDYRLQKGAWPGQAILVSEYASGMGANSQVPPEIKGWSWGGFLLTWIWGIGNSVWISLLSLLGFIPTIGWIISLIMRIVLGARGNEWAWQNKKWDSIEHFKTTQHKWMIWGIISIAAYVVLLVAMGILLLSIFMIVQSMGYDLKDWDKFIPNNL
jgi:hypothetical protein